MAPAVTQTAQTTACPDGCRDRPPFMPPASVGSLSQILLESPHLLPLGVALFGIGLILIGCALLCRPARSDSLDRRRVEDGSVAPGIPKEDEALSKGARGVELESTRSSNTSNAKSILTLTQQSVKAKGRRWQKLGAEELDEISEGDAVTGHDGNGLVGCNMGDAHIPERSSEGVNKTTGCPEGQVEMTGFHPTHDAGVPQCEAMHACACTTPAPTDTGTVPQDVAPGMAFPTASQAARTPAARLPKEDEQDMEQEEISMW